MAGGFARDTITAMNIYFAASIRGGRQDEDIYRRLIDELAHHGAVLTEHVADPETGEGGMTDSEIYQRDMAWLETADVVIAEVTTPSLGVGYEVASAERLGLEILCLFRPGSGKRLSAMVAGCPGIRVVPYETIDDATDAIETFLSSLNKPNHGE
jgi:nucleoside 2-deoxyribosyltransferase